MKSILPDAALNQHIAVLGKTGSGKTYAAKGIVEGLLTQSRQVCVVDPTGAWWGLRLAADGKARGFDVVLLGGKHADIPLAERSGAAVARLITQQGASVVLDTTGFTVGEYTRWFIDFAGTLYTTIQDPLHLVIDEAHYFMPQGGGGRLDVDAGRMLHAGNRLMSGGRSLGIRAMMITQRPAKLHKDSLSCADTLIAMRVVAPQDRKAIKEWIDGAGDPVQGKAVLDSLAQLKRGEGWAWYPEGGYLECVHFPRIRTYDSSATPAHGAKSGPKVSEIKLDEVREALAEAVREAEANDPALLRKRISELERGQRAPVVDQAAIDRAVAAAVAARDREWERAVKERETIIGELKDRMGKARQFLSVNGEATPQYRPTEKPAAALIPSRPAPVALQRRIESSEGGLSRMELAFLTVLAQHPDGLTKAQILTHTDYASSGSTSAAFAKMTAAGWADSPAPHALRITAAGLNTLGPFEPLPKGAALREMRLSSPKLSPMEKAILGVLFGNYPHGIKKSDILKATGYASSGSVSATFAKFARLGWAVKHDRSELKASDVFFE